MARRRRGRPVHGWLVVDKPSGVGSTPVVGRLRRALDARKAGHAGTLDPLATGVLAIAFGEATKTVGPAMGGLKTYRFTARWGAATDSDDADGTVIATSAAPSPDAAALAEALPDFEGDILQRPPGVSALKVNGRRAYDLAREGPPPELAPRPIRIERLRLIDATPSEASFEMTCGKGGYVRAVARDLGERFGCLGHIVALRRVRAGPFTVEQAVPNQAISFESQDAFSDREALEAALLPIETGLDDIPALTIDAETAADVRQGRAAPAFSAADRPPLGDGETVWVRHNGRPVALGIVTEGRFRPSRVFNLDDDEDDDVDHG